jgi:hypothetical protein
MITCCEIYTHCSFGVYHIRPTDKSLSRYLIFRESSAFNFRPLSRHTPFGLQLLRSGSSLVGTTHLNVFALSRSLHSERTLATQKRLSVRRAPASVLTRLENSVYSLLSELSLHRILSLASLSRIRVTLNESNLHKASLRHPGTSQNHGRTYRTCAFRFNSALVPSILSETGNRVLTSYSKKWWHPKSNSQVFSHDFNFLFPRSTALASPSQYMVTATLGQGTFGKVKLATHQETGRECKLLPNLADIRPPGPWHQPL